MIDYVHEVIPIFKTEKHVHHIK